MAIQSSASANSDCGAWPKRSVTVNDSKLPISVVIISKNAALSIRACLASVTFVDDIVVVDSGSVDATRDIAAQHGARIFEHEWHGFGPQKQFAVSQARHDWVLCLDADERVSPVLAQGLRAALTNPVHKVYAMPRCNRFMGRWLRHGEGYPDWSLRFFDRRHARWSDDAVHEKVVTGESVGKIAGDLLHESAEDLTEYLAKQNRYTTLQANILLGQGKRPTLIQLLLSPLARFCKFYFLRLGLLDGLPGLVHITIGCYNGFMKYAKLYELRRKQGTA